MVRTPLTAIALFGLVAAAACSRPGVEPTADEALRADLSAASQAVDGAAAAAPRTRFVSAIELGRAGDEAPAPAAAPRRARTASAPARTVARAVPAARRVPRPAPVRVESTDDGEVEARPADVPVNDVPAVDEPVVEAPPRDGPVIAVPSRRQPPEPPQPRRRGGWDMNDVIRNAPFPINP